MRTSQKKTTIAVLRAFLGIKDSQMAEILKRSRFTIHSLETGRLAIGWPLALRMMHETGISPLWLLGGDPKAPLIARDGRPYRREIFDLAQAKQFTQFE